MKKEDDLFNYNENEIIFKVLEIFSFELAKNYPGLTWESEYYKDEDNKDAINIIIHLFPKSNSFFAQKDISIYIVPFEDTFYFSLGADIVVKPKKDLEDEKIDTIRISISLTLSSQNRFSTRRYSYAKEKILQFLREVLNYRRSDGDEWFEINYYTELTKRLINKFTSELDEIDKEIYENIYEAIDEILRKKDEDTTQKKRYYILKYLLTQANLKEDIADIKKKVLEAIVLSKI